MNLAMSDQSVPASLSNPAEAAPLAEPLKAIFCRAYNCPPDRYTKQAFQRCLHRRALVVSWFLRRIRPRFFTLDQNLLAEVGEATDSRMLLAALQSFRQDCAANYNVLHEALRVRISGRRLLMVFDQAKSKLRARPKSAHQVEKA